MSINISELLSIPSVSRKYEAEAGFDRLTLGHGLHYDIKEKEPFVLQVAKDGQNLHVTGNTEVKLVMPCDRCLSDVEITLPVHIDRKAVLKKDPDGEGDDDDEQGFIEGCLLDADQLIRDELVIALPTKVLCREDCKGLCSTCGKNLNLGSCNCEKESRDPRMAAIADIFREFQEK